MEEDEYQWNKDELEVSRYHSYGCPGAQLLSSIAAPPLSRQRKEIGNIVIIHQDWELISIIIAKLIENQLYTHHNYNYF